MGYEINFLLVGDGETREDVIATRYAEPGTIEVMIYHGDTRAAGEERVPRAKEFGPAGNAGWRTACGALLNAARHRKSTRATTEASP